MAPSRGKSKARARKDVPSVFQDLLAETQLDELSTTESDRPLKRRKVAQRSRETQINKQSPHTAVSDDDDEDGFAFEDVDLRHHGRSSAEDEVEDEDGIQDVTVSLGPSSATAPRSSTKRRPATAAEKGLWLTVHKAHLLCLLAHCFYRNSWCNNKIVQRHLRPLLSDKTISYLNPKSSHSQFQRNRSFMDGLEQASQTFRGEFRVTESGMHRIDYSSAGHAETSQTASDSIERSDFITAAKEMRGSQDVGNQLFCALLRSIGVEARLACSLQPLPFTGPAAKTYTPQKFVKPTIFATTPRSTTPASDSNMEDAAVQQSASIGKVPSARRRIGQPSFTNALDTTTTPEKRKSIRKLSYPIYWVEAFNAAHQKWIPVDPIVTQTVNRASKLEPPISYSLNQMSYVFAFESDAVVRDVTRRYTKSYNAKNRRARVEITEGGPQWLKKALRIFRRRGPALDRDQVEGAELAAKEAREGLPTNIQDFKHHPHYALERHLRRNEVIEPKRQVGKVNAGTAANPRMEAVYRRQDVQTCRSADKWHRLGRQIRTGEQPLSHIVSRARRASSADDEDDNGEAKTSLYAFGQTDLYIPPPIVNGKVPRNAFGNLDIYVPSMVPAGGIHIAHPLASRAAKLLRIDYADAVTGFQFKGRHGTPIITGVVVAEGYKDGVWAVIDGLLDEKTEEEGLLRSAAALRMWRRLLVGLRIQERVSGYGGGGEERGGDLKEEVDRAEEEMVDVAGSGGFLPDAGEMEALPTAGRFSLMDLGSKERTSVKRARRKKSESSEEESDGDLAGTGETGEDGDNGGQIRRSARQKRRVVEDDPFDEDFSAYDATYEDSHAQGDGGDGEGEGGFPPEDNDAGDEAGLGFFPENNDDATQDATTSDVAIHQQNKETHVDITDPGGACMINDSNELAPRRISSVPNDPSSDQGGGFVLEDDASHEVKLPSAVNAADGDAPPLLPSDENATDEIEMSGALVPDSQQLPRSLRARSVEEDEETAHVEAVVVQDEQARHLLPGPWHETADNLGDDHREEDGDDEDDKGSMLSHDPEDEDAEPDWLDSEPDV